MNDKMRFYSMKGIELLLRTVIFYFLFKEYLKQCIKYDFFFICDPTFDILN